MDRRRIEFPVGRLESEYSAFVRAWICETAAGVFRPVCAEAREGGLDTKVERVDPCPTNLGGLIYRIDDDFMMLTLQSPYAFPHYRETAPSRIPPQG